MILRCRYCDAKWDIKWGIWGAIKWLLKKKTCKKF